MKAKLTDEELIELRNRLKTIYPWYEVNNTIYNAELISTWNISTSNQYAKEIIEDITSKRERI